MSGDERVLQTAEGGILGKSTAMTHRIAVTAALVAIAVPSVGIMAQALEPTPMFDANITIPAKNGGTQAARIVVQSWAISGKEHEIPLSGFYVAHLRSGAISATIAGQTTEHLPGDYWTVKAGATMRVKAIGEVAVLETTVVSKQ
jgi:quercetin dioxygenase-like cupin family protein